jgi:hypothetical protein
MLINVEKTMENVPQAPRPSSKSFRIEIPKTVPQIFAELHAKFCQLCECKMYDAYAN